MITWLLVGTAVGGALGWTLRNSMGSTRTRVLDELYSRKLRHAEQLRDESIKTLNANKVEMAGYAERFAGLDAQIVSLTEARLRAVEAREASDLAFNGREQELAHWRETAAEEVRTCAEARQRMTAAEDRSEAAAAAMDQAYDEVVGLTTRLAGAEQLAAAAGARNVELELQLAKVEQTLASERVDATSLERELALAREVLVQRDLELSRVREHAAELEPLRGEVLARDVALAERAEKIARLGARIEELAPLAAELEPTRREVLARDAALAERAQEIARLGAQIDELAPLAAELEPARGELLARDAVLAERAQEIARLRARIDELAPLAAALPGVREERDAFSLRTLEQDRQLAVAATVARELAELRAAHAEIGELQRTTGQELARALERSAKLDAASRAHESEARESQRESARLEKELSSARAGFEARQREFEQQERKTAHELARERDRSAKGDLALQAREADARESQRECTRLEKELRASEASLEVRQRDLARKDAKIAGLEAALAERNDRIRALTPVLRPASPRGILRPQPSKRGAKSRAADDLKRIAGIGPVLAKKLQRLGVETFDQLAELTRGDLESLAEKLGIAAERIRREGWISSARVEARARDSG